MYKNKWTLEEFLMRGIGFNPCFNGSMYKNTIGGYMMSFLMFRFNPCFNGSMYKNQRII